MVKKFDSFNYIDQIMIGLYIFYTHMSQHDLNQTRNILGFTIFYTTHKPETKLVSYS